MKIIIKLYLNGNKGETIEDLILKELDKLSANLVSFTSNGHKGTLAKDLTDNGINIYFDHALGGNANTHCVTQNYLNKKLFV
jgi:hypothetical protein